LNVEKQKKRFGRSYRVVSSEFRRKKYRNSVSCAKCKTYKETFSLFIQFLLLFGLRKVHSQKKDFADKRKEIFETHFVCELNIRPFRLRYRFRIGAKIEINEENVKCEFSPLEGEKTKEQKKHSSSVE
jgi:hypothetical protein